MDLKHLIQSLGRTLDEEDNRAFNLWTWLPSYRHANMAFGDYGDVYQPPLADMLQEASYVFSTLKGYGVKPSTALEWFSIEDARGKLGEDEWTLDDIQAFFKEMYNADVVFEAQKLS